MKPTSRFALLISSISLKTPRTKPVPKLKMAPRKFNRLINKPNRNTAAIGGEIYACTL